MRERSMPIMTFSGWHSRMACSAVIGPMVDVPVDLAASVGSGEAVPLALTVWMFIGAAIWMFQRWGRGVGARAPATHPEAAAFKRAGT